MFFLLCFVDTRDRHPLEAKRSTYSGRGRAPPLHTFIETCTHGGVRSRRPTNSSRRQDPSNQRPKAATYLCRFAAKARFDNRQPPKGVSKEGGPQPSLFGRSRKGDFQGGRKTETSFPLEWRSLDTFFRQGKKVSRRRHPAPGRGTPLPFGKESNQSETKKKEEALGRGRAPPLRDHQTLCVYETYT